MSKTYGYVRVSSREQNEDRQVLAMLANSVEKQNIFIDKKSGKDFDRPAYQKLLKKVREGDLVIIKSIDRLGRNYNEVLEQWKILTKVKRADLYVIDMPILDTRTEKKLMGTFITDLVLAILSFVAENERENIRSRQAEGIAAAKMRGVQFGRPKEPLPKEFEETCAKWYEKSITLSEAAKICGMKRSTFYLKARSKTRDYMAGEIDSIEK